MIWGFNIYLMKHIKPINEFTRTIGFRYSEPAIGYRAILFCVGKLSKNSFLQLLNFSEIKNEKVKISKEENKVNTEEGEIETDLVIEFDFFVYSEQELERIVEDVRNGLQREFNVQTFDFLLKELPKLKKK